MGRKSIAVSKPAKGYQRKLQKRREAKVFEGPKACLLVKGGKTSATVVQVLRDLARLKKPLSRMLLKRNELRPMEVGGEASLEFLCNKNDAALFAVGSHSKKRPHNLVLGRTFDNSLLDAIEVGVEDFVGLDEAARLLPKGTGTMRVGSKPLLVFKGDSWDHGGEVMKRLRNLLLDFFVGADCRSVSMSGFDHVIMCTAVGRDTAVASNPNLGAGVSAGPSGVRLDSGSGHRIKLRHYHVELSRDRTKLASAPPAVSLKPLGGSMDLVLRRARIAPVEVWREALRLPKQARPRKIKNVTRDAVGNKRGHIYPQPQNFDNLQMKKMKALKRSRDGAEAEGTDAGDGGAPDTAETPAKMPRTSSSEP